MITNRFTDRVKVHVNDFFFFQVWEFENRCECDLKSENF